jgi:hypothetical protein
MKVINMDDHRPPASPSKIAKIISDEIDANNKEGINEVQSCIWALSYSISRLVHAQKDISATVNTIDAIFSQYADPSVYQDLYDTPPDTDKG